MGVKKEMLLSYVNCPEEHVSVPHISTVSNRLLLELVRFKNEHAQCTFRILYCWVQDLFGINWPEEPPTLQSFTKSIERLQARLDKLKKQHTSTKKDSNIEMFLDEEYHLPSIGLRRGQVLHFSPAKKENPRAKAEFKEMQQKMYALTRNANKKIKRRDAKIEEQKKQIALQTRLINNDEQMESQVSELKAKLNRITHRASYWKSKVSDLKERNAMKTNKLHQEIEVLKETTSSLDFENAELDEQLQNFLSSDDIVTFEGGKYTDSVRACVYELLSLNVGVKNIAPAIRCVIKNLAERSVGRLPSYGLTCQMIIESLVVVQAQLGHELSHTETFSTLQTDGTTKFGIHYGAFDVRVCEADERTTYTLGIRHVFSGAAKDTLETLKEILTDLDSVQLALGKDSASSVIISKIKNTMSDRHSAEKLFNQLLEEYRKDILPDITENWPQMSELERDQLTSMNNFFCGLHYLVGLADTAVEVLKKWEMQSSSSVNAHLDSSCGTERLVRTACKAFHHRGSQQAGSSLLFRTYLKKEGIAKIPLAQFVGNRFNILFYDAAGVYYLRNHMQHFIESVHGVEANRLLQAVLSDLKSQLYVSGCRALGLIDKLVTGPLWRKIQDSSTSVLDMGPVYCELVEKFDSWGLDSQSITDGSALLDRANSIHVDEVWAELIADHDSNVLTQELLQLLCKAFSITTNRLLIDHLPGGKFYTMDAELIRDTGSVPTTNVSPERDFAVLDRVLREKPNATLIALEAFILFSHNKTSKWLDDLPAIEKEKLINAARMLVPSMKKKFKIRQNEIQQRNEESLLKKQRTVAEKHRRELEEKEKLTNEIAKSGLWTSRTHIREGLAAVSKKTEKVRLLKLQIKFRRKVLHQTNSDSSLFKFSQNSKQFSVQRLQDNLIKLLSAEEQATLAEEQAAPAEEQAAPADDNVTSADEQATLLEQVLQAPEYLVGQKINHRFEVEGELVWFKGTVKSYDSKTKEFLVFYDGEEDPCCFELLQDIEYGDLLLVIQ